MIKNNWDKRIKNVTWGYRDKFSEALQRIRETGYLDVPDDDPSYKAFDKTYMELVGKDYCRDHAADVFLKALDKKLSWIISIPELMENWSGYGLKLLDIKLYYAIRYFELWNSNPAITDLSEMRMIMDHIIRIEAAMGIGSSLSFLEGYPCIREVLEADKVHDFVREGIRMFDKKPSLAGKFFKLELASAKMLIEQISKRCCLKDIRPRLERLLHGICGIEFKIDKTQELDSDELMEKGSDTICFGKSLYLPSMVSEFEDIDKNTRWYLAASCANAFAHLFKGFPTMHGVTGYGSSKAYLARLGVSYSPLTQDLFYIVDVYRILQAAYKVFPRVKVIIKTVFSYHEQVESVLDEILKRVVLNKRSSQKDDMERFIEVVGEIAEKCENFQDIVNFIPLIKKTFSRSSQIMRICT